MNSKEWKEANRGKISEYNKKYREDNKEYFQKYRKEHKEYINAYSRKMYANNIEAERNRSKNYREENPEKALIRKRLWRKNNYAKYIAGHRAYMKNNLNAKLANGLRARVILAIKAQNAQKKGHTEQLLGCSIPNFRIYIEKQFIKGMDWKNWGRASSLVTSDIVWHIDHKIPCVSFDLTKLEEQKKCFHYTNLQPLWAFDNLSKGSKIIVNETLQQTTTNSFQLC